VSTATLSHTPEWRNQKRPTITEVVRETADQQHMLGAGADRRLAKRREITLER
jgi:hypothetical protein